MARSSVERNEEFGTLSNGTLIFPQDMEKDFYPEAIKFGIYERQGPSYKNLKAALTTDTKKSLDVAIKTNEEKSDAEEAGNSATNGNRNLLGKALDSTGGFIDGIADATTSLIRSTGVGNALLAENKLKKETAIEKHLQSVYLHMPSAVTFNEAVSWEGKEQGVIGALRSGASMGQALEGGLLSNAGAILGGSAAMMAGGGIAGSVIGGVLGESVVQGNIEGAFNIKGNPFKEQTFQGVDFRAFDFTFILRARSQSDVDVIQQIIRAFRAHSKPTFEKGTGGAVFAYPKEFKIEFLTIDSNNSYETNEYLPEIKYCVCTGVNTNYTGQGWRSFEYGAPVDISLQLTFQETEIITGEDVMGETEVGRYKDSERMF